jgi:nicotinamidase-related amidase
MVAAHPTHLDRQQAQLLVVDFQEKLLPSIADYATVTAQAQRMIRAAVILGLPITVSEQYPRGLGPTVPAIREAPERADQVPSLQRAIRFTVRPPA